MNTIKSLEEINKLLSDICSDLDEEAYDDISYEEYPCDSYYGVDLYEAKLEILYPDIFTNVLKKSAELGSIPGMEMYGVYLYWKAYQMKINRNEHSQVMAEATHFIRQAALQGSLSAIEYMLGNLELDIEKIEKLAFELLYSGDLWEKSTENTSEEEIKAATTLYYKIKNEMHEKGVTKQSYWTLPESIFM
ncbi:hypothetical protein [Spartinivicinus poritis]|nr:hypothetical protein [Spartinivicinus sp. A2-2]